MEELDQDFQDRALSASQPASQPGIEPVNQTDSQSVCQSAHKMGVGRGHHFHCSLLLLCNGYYLFSFGTQVTLFTSGSLRGNHRRESMSQYCGGKLELKVP